MDPKFWILAVLIALPVCSTFGLYFWDWWFSRPRR